MPVSKFICKGCSNREVPLDHFATTRCGETVCHPDYAAAVLADRSGQPEGVRVTHGLSCPRRAAIEASEPYAMDPVDSLPACSGTAWHAWVEPHGGDSAEVEVRGTVAGINVVGHIDRVRGDTIEDWKTVQFLPKGMEVKPEHVVQVSIYAHLLNEWTKLPAEEATFSEELELNLNKPRYTKGRIWYKTHFDLRAVEFPLMPIEEALAWKPYGGEYAVWELYSEMDDFLHEPDFHWTKMALAGQSMRFGNGKSLCDWCQVRETCTIAAMGSEEF